MKTNLKICWVWVLMALAWQVGVAQRDEALLRELAEENKQSIEALVLYPEDVRLAILEATKEPALLVRMQSLKAKTSAAFRTLIEDYPRDAQERLYDLSRYPGLPGALAGASDAQARVAATSVLPESERDAAAVFAAGNRGVLRKIQELYDTSNQAFESMVAPYPAPLQVALRKLLSLPEVVDILNEDLRFTVMVGDLYREDPAWVLQKMDSLNLTVARAHAEEMEAWKKNLNEDPQARQEMQEVARAYAAETYGYDGEDYPYGPNEYGPDAVAVDYVVFHPYPYWFGYPWWYTAPRWRPYPYWYDWGYYPYWDNWIVVSMPSYYFMHWYFDHPHYCYRYNYLSTHFVRHYYHYRRSGTTISVGVGEWRNRTRTIISDEWLSDQDRLPDRLKEYGRFEENRQQYNGRHTGKEQSADEFLDKNAKKYPQLADSRKIARAEAERVRVEEARKTDAWAPTKEPARRDAPDAAKPAPTPARPARVPEVKPAQKPEKPTQAPVRPPRQEPERKIKPPTEKPQEVAPIDKAKDYHRQKWEEPKPAKAPSAQPERKSVTPKQAPSPKPSPAPAKKPSGKDQKVRGG